VEGCLVGGWGGKVCVCVWGGCFGGERELVCFVGSKPARGFNTDQMRYCEQGLLTLLMLLACRQA